MPEINVSNWTELGGFGLLGGAFVFVLRWLLTKFDEAQAATTRAIERMTQSIVGTANIQAVALLNLQSQLMLHDLTVSGLNPSAGGDVDERSNKAFKKYTEILQHLEDMKRVLLAEVATR